MEDRLGKYLRLFGSVFFLFIGILLILVSVFLGLRLLFGLMNYIPWMTYVYMIFILLVPSMLFITCYIIYFKRTAAHPNKAVRWISYSLFTIALIAWIIYCIMDIIIFSKHAYTAIAMYHSFNMIFLALNITCFFLVGVMQALTSAKEVDWMERQRTT